MNPFLSIFSKVRLNFLTYFKSLKTILGVLIIAGVIGLPYAKAQRIDSLKALLVTVKDTSRFTILYELFRSTNQTNFDEALGYAEQAYRYAEMIGDSVRIVEGGRMIAFSLLDLGRNDEAINILNKTIAIALRNQDRHPEVRPKIKFLLNNAAIAYMYRGNYDSSLSYHFRSLQIREAEGDKRSIGTAKNNIGLVYFKLRNHEKALEYYQQALAIKREIGDNGDLVNILINIGLCYNELSAPAKALVSFNEALDLCGSKCSELAIKESNYGLGVANSYLENFDQARINFQTSLTLSKQHNDIRYWVENLIGLARIEIKLTNYDQGLAYFSEATKLAEEADYVELLLSIYKDSYRAYGLISDFQNEAYYQQRYIVLKDSIYSNELIRNLARVQTDFEERENLRTIQEKDENIRLQRELISRQQTQYIFIVVITVLIVGLALVLVWANRRQHRHNLALSEAKRTIEAQNKELTKTNTELDKRVQEKTRDLFNLNETLTKSNEELDNFIYRTSHDIRGPLVTLKGVCNVAAMDVKDPLALEYLKRLDITAEKLNSILTRLLVVNQINHAVLEANSVDFNRMISEILDGERKQGMPARMEVTYQVAPGTNLISDTYLLKIILENLIDNAIKFYNTSDRIDPFVRVSIESTGNKVRIKVEDNGIGINAEDKADVFHPFVRASERSETGGIGLYLSRLATQRLEGEIKLVATSDKGSTFHVLLPRDLRPILAKRKEAEEQLKKERAQREKEGLLTETEA